MMALVILRTLRAFWLASPVRLCHFLERLLRTVEVFLEKE